MKPLIRWVLAKLFGLKPTSAPSKYGYAGSFQSWTEAKSEFHGYQDPQIADRVASGARAVLEGTAAYERDSITFSSRQYSFPVAVALMWAGLKNHGDLKVLDFGGGLGTSIVQNQPFLGTLNNVSWTIIEQPTFVAQSKELFDGAAVVFGDDIGADLKRLKPDLVLLSSSLQYVEKPFEILQLVTDTQVEMVVLDRTLFSGAAHDFVTRQKVPDDIFPATIPVWIFSETKFCAFMERRYRRMSRFASSQTTVDWDSDGRKLEELGFIYVLKGSAYDSLLEAPASLLERKND